MSFKMLNSNLLGYDSQKRYLYTSMNKNLKLMDIFLPEFGYYGRGGDKFSSF